MNHQAVKRATKAAAEAAAEIDTEIQVIEQQIDGLHERVKELRRERERWTRLATPPATPSPEAASMTSAGPAAVTAVAHCLREHGKAYQYEITRETGLNSGTVTHALRVLAHNHTIAATGRKRRNSAEFEWTGQNDVKLVKGSTKGKFAIKDHVRTTAAQG